MGPPWHWPGSASARVCSKVKPEEDGGISVAVAKGLGCVPLRCEMGLSGSPTSEPTGLGSQGVGRERQRDGLAGRAFPAAAWALQSPLPPLLL